MGLEVLLGLIVAVLSYFIGRRQGMLQALYERRVELVSEIYKCIIEMKREFEVWAQLSDQNDFSMLDYASTVESQLGELKDHCEENRVWFENRTLERLDNIFGRFDQELTVVRGALAEGTPGVEDNCANRLRIWLADFEAYLQGEPENHLREITKGTGFKVRAMAGGEPYRPAFAAPPRRTLQKEGGLHHRYPARHGGRRSGMGFGGGATSFARYRPRPWRTDLPDCLPTPAASSRCAAYQEMQR